jgi:hypothetical protein
MLPKPLILHPLQASLPHRRGRGPPVETGSVGAGRDGEVCGVKYYLRSAQGGAAGFVRGARTVKICFAVQVPIMR